MNISAVTVEDNGSPILPDLTNIIDALVRIREGNWFNSTAMYDAIKLFIPDNYVIQEDWTLRFNGEWKESSRKRPFEKLANLCIPINIEHEHWLLLLAYGDTMELYDPFPSQPYLKRHRDSITKRMSVLAPDKTQVIITNWIAQRNTSDCGPLVSLYAIFRINNMTPPCDEASIDVWRRAIYVGISKGTNLEEETPPFDPRQMSYCTLKTLSAQEDSNLHDLAYCMSLIPSQTEKIYEIKLRKYTTDLILSCVKEVIDASDIKPENCEAETLEAETAIQACKMLLRLQSPTISPLVRDTQIENLLQANIRYLKRVDRMQGLLRIRLVLERDSEFLSEKDGKLVDECRDTFSKAFNRWMPEEVKCSILRQLLT